LSLWKSASILIDFDIGGLDGITVASSVATMWAVVRMNIRIANRIKLVKILRLNFI